MNEKEFDEYRQEAIRFYLARCLEQKIISFKRKKDFKALFSLFNSAIRVF
jgi:serine/threonine-protein kinase RIO1